MVDRYVLRLVWYAPNEIMTEAIQRGWKLNLIGCDHPDWIDRIRCSRAKS
jgi:hypothetical protein